MWVGQAVEGSARYWGATAPNLPDSSRLPLPHIGSKRRLLPSKPNLPRDDGGPLPRGQSFDCEWRNLGASVARRPNAVSVGLGRVLQCVCQTHVEMPTSLCRGDTVSADTEAPPSPRYTTHLCPTQTGKWLTGHPPVYPTPTHVRTPRRSPFSLCLRVRNSRQPSVAVLAGADPRCHVRRQRRRSSRRERMGVRKPMDGKRFVEGR